MFAGQFDHFRKLRIAFAALADVAGIDAVFGQRAGALRVVAEQLVAVEMKIADQRHRTVVAIERFTDVGHSGSGFRVIHGNAHQFGAGTGQLQHLLGGCGYIRGIGIGHRLHNDRVAAAHGDAVDIDCD